MSRADEDALVRTSTVWVTTPVVAQSGLWLHQHWSKVLVQMVERRLFLRAERTTLSG